MAARPEPSARRAGRARADRRAATADAAGPGGTVRADTDTDTDTDIDTDIDTGFGFGVTDEGGVGTLVAVRSSPRKRRGGRTASRMPR